MNKFQSLGLGVLFASAFSSCNPGDFNPKPTPIPPTTGAQLNACYREEFPAASEVSSPVDVLIVTDSVQSDFDRVAFARSLGSLVSAFPAKTSFQFGVLGGYSSETPGFAQLVGAPLSTDTSSVSVIQEHLLSTINTLTSRQDSGGGQEGLVALSHLLDPDQLALARGKNFFRDGAKLLVVFASGRLDACSKSAGHFDSALEQADCAGISPASVLAKVEQTFPDKNVSFAGIFYTTGFANPPFAQTATGYFNLVQLANGAVLDFSAGYPQAWSAIGGFAAKAQGVSSPNQFMLTRSGIDPASIYAKVGTGFMQGVKYDSDSNQVTLPGAAPYGETVQIGYCIKKQGYPCAIQKPLPLCARYNFPGVYTNGNIISADRGYDGGKGSFCLMENSDGTLTFMSHDQNTQDGSVFGVSFEYDFGGALDHSIDGETSSVIFAAYGLNLSEVQRVRPVSCSLAQPEFSDYYHLGDTCARASCGSGGCIRQNAPAVFGSNDSVLLGSDRWMRLRLYPTGAPGSRLTLEHISHFTESQFNWMRNYYDDGAQNDTLVLNGVSCPAPSPSVTPSATPSITPSPSPSPISSPSPSPSPSATPSPSPSACTGIGCGGGGPGV